MKGIKDTNIKNVIEINVPNGKSTEQFDDDVMRSARDFENNTQIKYRVIPTDELEGNCNTSTTSLLKNVGVPMDEINKIGADIKGTTTGFGTVRAWTDDERKKNQEDYT